MKVKLAKPGLIIRDPHSRLPLPEEGGDVPENSFWIRRLMDGDVLRHGEVKAKPDKQPTEKPEKPDKHSGPKRG